MLKKITNNFGLAIGIIGLIIFMFGLTETDTAQKYLIVLFATFFLFLSADIQNEHFFTGLQGIAFVSAIM
ncbi:MFS transporter, partial [Francisella tularensis subsp. holarctica]|nr:MFS transporter [Francisella tularensis subsp. holarctica]